MSKSDNTFKVIKTSIMNLLLKKALCTDKRNKLLMNFKNMKI